MGEENWLSGKKKHSGHKVRGEERQAIEREESGSPRGRKRSVSFTSKTVQQSTKQEGERDWRLWDLAAPRKGQNKSALHTSTWEEHVPACHEKADRENFGAKGRKGPTRRRGKESASTCVKEPDSPRPTVKEGLLLKSILGETGGRKRREFWLRWLRCILAAGEKFQTTKKTEGTPRREWKRRPSSEKASVRSRKLFEKEK